MTHTTTRKMVLLVVFALGATACSKSGDTPTQVADKFYDALATGDLETVRKESTPETATLIETLVSKNGQDAFQVPEGRTADGETISGDQAVVRYRNADGSEAAVPLVKLGGAWKVDFHTVIKAASQGNAGIPDPISE
ncbi:MAG: hypothetical protein AAGF92_08860 [Myxococcota bacterium]